MTLSDHLHEGLRQLTGRPHAADGPAVRGEAAADLQLNGFLVFVGPTTWHDGLKERSVGGVFSSERQEDSIVVDDPPGRCTFEVQSGSYALLFLSLYILAYG